jgi:hypothetical protein
MYVLRLLLLLDDDVESADSLAILSCIQILWCLGKNCMAVGTRHIIVYFQQQADRFDDDVESADV